MVGSERGSLAWRAARTIAQSSRIPGANHLGGNHLGARRSRGGRPVARFVAPALRRGVGSPEAIFAAAGTITLKLKTTDFRVRTRSRRMADPTQLADTLFHTAASLLAGEPNGVTPISIDRGWCRCARRRPRRLTPRPLFEGELDGPRRLEQAIDQIRSRLGDGSVQFGRGLSRIDLRTGLAGSRRKDIG